MEFYIKKRTMPNGDFLYDVFDENGTKIGQRRSKRTYVACLVGHVPPREPGVYQIWFGREDLIGKGSSRHYVGKPHVFIARLRP